VSDIAMDGVHAEVKLIVIGWKHDNMLISVK